MRSTAKDLQVGDKFMVSYAGDDQWNTVAEPTTVKDGKATVSYHTPAGPAYNGPWTIDVPENQTYPVSR